MSHLVKNIFNINSLYLGTLIIHQLTLITFYSHEPPHHQSQQILWWEIKTSLHPFSPSHPPLPPLPHLTQFHSLLKYKSVYWSALAEIGRAGGDGEGDKEAAEGFQRWRWKVLHLLIYFEFISLDLEADHQKMVQNWIVRFQTEIIVWKGMDFIYQLFCW